MPTQRKVKRRNGNVSLAAVEGSSVVLVDVRRFQTAVCCLFSYRSEGTFPVIIQLSSFAHVKAIWIFPTNKILDKTFFLP